MKTISIRLDKDDQPTVGLRPFINVRGKCGYNGSNVQVGIPISDEESLEITGSAKDLREFFKAVLDSIEHMDKTVRRELGPLRDTDCPNCREPLRSEPDDNSTHTVECQKHWVGYCPECGDPKNAHNPICLALKDGGVMCGCGAV